jgi:serine phosphatase RsbU (regulator of sigma subunit)/ligand-binding sensor domain-containing protein
MFKYICVTITILLFANNIHSQENYVFEHFSIPEGLSNPTVFSVLQDSYGFLWVGTADGLNRYDGYEFKVYKNDPDDPNSLPPGSELWALAEDHDGNLWIGGQNILVKYDRKNDGFIPVQFDVSLVNSANPLVYKIFVDSKNRIWVGTRRHGIHLINTDTYSTEAIKVLDDDGMEIKANTNFSIIETHKEEILVSDVLKRILIFNEKQNYLEVYNIPKYSAQGVVFNIFEDDFNKLWISFWQGDLIRYDPSTEEIETVDIYKSVKTEIRDRSIMSIYKDQEGFLWIGTFTNGLFKYNPVTEEFTHLYSDISKPNKLHGNEISSIFQDQFGILWIGTFTSGLNKVDPKKQPFNVYRLPQAIRKNTFDDNINAITKTKNNDDIWIGTQGSGLVRYNLQTKDYSNFTYNLNSKNSLSSNRIITLAADGNDNIWIGTDSSINRLNTLTGTIEEFFRNDRNLVFNYQANNLKVDNTGRLFIANSNGVDIFYPLQEQVKSIPTINNRTYDKRLFSDIKDLTGKNKIIASILKVGEAKDTSITFSLSEKEKVIIIAAGEGEVINNISYDYGWLEDRDGEILWAMENIKKTFHLGGGYKNRTKLGVLELKPGDYVLRFKSDVGHSFGNWNVTPPADSSLWGIQLIKINDEQYKSISKRLESELKNKDYMSLGGALYLAFSNKYENILWIGSLSEGLFEYNLSDNSYKQFRIDSVDAQDSRKNNVYFVMEDSKGEVWFSSVNGLGHLNSETDEIKFYTQKDGLPTNYVNAIQEDNYGNLWISSVAGLTMMVRGSEDEKETFVNIDIKDGLQGYTFTYATWKSNVGELYFGGMNGINVFLPGKTNQTMPKIVLTDIKISDESVLGKKENSPLTDALNNIEELNLSYDQNDIAFQFAPIHYSRPERNQIAYMLEGFNEDWVYSKLRYASFTNLDPGDYIFKLKAANGDGIWSNDEKQIAITILPPWWRTTLAYILYGVFIVLTFVGLDRFQRRRLMSKAREKARMKEAEMRATLAEAENERKSKELEEARQLQLSMLPKELPQLPNLDIAVYMKTATEVGGDYYDFNVGMDGTLTVVIGDATGHGMKAGTMVTAAKSLFNTHAANPDILFTFNEITRCIKQMNIHMLSMCMTIIKIQGNNIVMSAAGMPPALIYRKQDMAVEEIVIKGMPLGAVSDFPYQLRETKINSGDTMLLLSDGLPELFNKDKEMFSYERVVQEFSKNAHKSPEDIIDSLKTAGSDWVEDEDPDDDVTFVVIKVK